MSQGELEQEVPAYDTEQLGAAVDDEIERVEKEETKTGGEMSELVKHLDSFEEERDKLRVVCEEVDEAEAEQESFRELLDGLCAAKEQLEKVSTTEEEMAVPLQYEESKQRALFQKCMGLEFRITEDQAVCLVYRYLDPERKFSITMDVDQQSQWTVVGMEPHVHGVRTELNELNSSGNFKHFCKAIRSKFKEYAAMATEEQ